MEFIDGSRGVYRPIRVLFDLPIYKRALQICWHMPSYRTKIALVTHLLRFQQKNLLPSEVTAEDMTDLLVEQSKSSLRLQLWEFELEDFDEDVAKPLLKLVWKVNVSLKMRDVEFEARRLLSSPETIPPQFHHPKNISLAQSFARTLTEQQQKAPNSNLLAPREVVLEVVPKVVQSFWLPPANTCFSMISQQLSNMAVGVTKAVEDQVSTALSSMLLQVTFTRSIRDDMVLCIQEKVRHLYPEDVLRKKVNCFAAELLKTISDVAASEICVLFQPRTHTNVSQSVDTREDCTQPADVVDGEQSQTSPAEDVNEESGLEEDGDPVRVDHSAVVTPPPTPPIISAEAAVNLSVQNGSNRSLTETEEQPTPCPPRPLSPATEPPVTASVLDGEKTSPHLSTREPDSAMDPAPPALLILADKPPVISAAQDDLTATDEPPANIVVATTPPTPVTPPADGSPVISAANSPIHGLNNSLDEAEQQPALILEPAVISHPPAPLTLPPETPANADKTSYTLQLSLSPEPGFALVATPPTLVMPPADERPVISVVQDDLTTTAELPAFSSIHNVLTKSLDESGEPPLLSPEPAVVSPPPAPLTSSPEPPANAGNTLQPSLSPELDSTFINAPPSPVTPPADESPVISAANSTIHGLKNSLDDAEQQPALIPEPAVVSPPPAPLTSSPEPPANAANTLQPSLSPEPDFALVATPPNLVTPPADERPVISAVQDDLTTTAELPAFSSIHNVLTKSLEESGEPPLLSSESAVVSPPPAPLTSSPEPPANAANTLQPSLSPEPDSSFVTTPPSHVTPPADGSPVISAANSNIHGLKNSLDDVEQQPALILEPAVISPPPAPLTLPLESPANADKTSYTLQPRLSPEPDFALVATPPNLVTPPADERPVISAVQDDLTTTAELPAFSSIHNVLTKSLDESGEPPLLSSESAVVSPPPAPLTSSPEPPANAANTLQPSLSPEPDSSFVTTPPSHVTPPADGSPVISAANSTIHGLKNSLDDAEQQPALIPEAAVISPPPALLTSSPEPPANAANTLQPSLSPEPDFALVATPLTLVTPPADERPVISAVQDDLTTTAELPAFSSIHNVLTKSLDESGEPPLLSPEPAVVSPPPAPLTSSPEHPANAANTLQPSLSPEPDSSFVNTPPSHVTPPVDDLPARVDESFDNRKELKKTKNSRFRRFLRWLQKRMCCCCCAPEDDT